MPAQCCRQWPPTLSPNRPAHPLCASITPCQCWDVTRTGAPAPLVEAGAALGDGGDAAAGGDSGAAAAGRDGGAAAAGGGGRSEAKSAVQHKAINAACHESMSNAATYEPSHSPFWAPCSPLPQAAIATILAERGKLSARGLIGAHSFLPTAQGSLGMLKEGGSGGCRTAAASGRFVFCLEPKL